LLQKSLFVKKVLVKGFIFELSYINRDIFEGNHMDAELIYYAKAAAFLGAAFCMGFGSFGPAIAQGIIGMKACESIAKYPENANKIRPAMIMALGLVETSAVYALLIAGALLYIGFAL